MKSLKTVVSIIFLFVAMNTYAGTNSLTRHADSINACIQAIGSNGEEFTAALTDGSRIQIVRSHDGRMPSMKLVRVDGEEQILLPRTDSSEHAPRARTSSIPDLAVPQGRQIADHFGKMVERYCMQLGKSPTLRKSQQKISDPTDTTDFDLWPEQVFSPSMWDIVDAQVGDAFYLWHVRLERPAIIPVQRS